MAFTSTDLAAIDAAIASGQLQVEYEHRRVIYRSIADLKAARNLIVQEIAKQDGHRRVRQVRTMIGKGT